MYYLYNFVIYSIFGFIFETIFSYILKFNTESGFMYGPYTIVYGIGIVFIFLLYKKFKSVNPEIKKITYMFISGFITLTILEFIGGILLKNIYNIEMWNYKKLPLNIGEYISIEVSTIWAIGSILIYYYIKPLTDKLIKKIPKIIIIGISLIMLFDFILTNINYFLK